ncbi:unnamed protein product [Fusarium graminearum]|uniref:Uncharacterized protein n=1 Tax=Gibberella zeae TaxID=5518 RepID=A0A4E9DX26_GIBZA
MIRHTGARGTWICLQATNIGTHDTAIRGITHRSNDFMLVANVSPSTRIYRSRLREHLLQQNHPSSSLPVAALARVLHHQRKTRGLLKPLWIVLANPF